MTKKTICIRIRGLRETLAQIVVSPTRFGPEETPFVYGQSTPHRRLPSPNSALNCWEGVSVLLYLYHALSKQDVLTAYSVATYNGDEPAVNALFGLENKAYTHTLSSEELQGFVKTGDVLIFHSNRSSSLCHVALVLDNFEKLWVASHWCLPREKMIKCSSQDIIKQTVSLRECVIF